MLNIKLLGICQVTITKKAISTTGNDLLKRFPKSAMVYFELLKVYTKKGDVEKIKELGSKLKEATIYADKGMFETKKK